MLVDGNVISFASDLLEPIPSFDGSWTDEASCWLLLGVTLMTPVVQSLQIEGERFGAVDCFSQCLRLASSSTTPHLLAKAWCSLGIWLHSRSKSDTVEVIVTRDGSAEKVDAYSCFSKATWIDPEYPTSFIFKGATYADVCGARAMLENGIRLALTQRSRSIAPASQHSDSLIEYGIRNLRHFMKHGEVLDLPGYGWVRFVGKLGRRMASVQRIPSPPDSLDGLP